MPNLKLSYFDFHGGRGEVARLALSIGGVPFEDDRVAIPDWPRRKKDMPFGALPVLEVDGHPLAQSNAINRYVGQLTGLYPSDPLQAALCDEAMDAVVDVVSEIAGTMFLEEAEKKAKREALAAGPIPFFLTCLQRDLASRGGRYFADDRLTIADLKVAMLIKQLKSGVVDYVPSDLADQVAPRLVAHHRQVLDHPGVRAHYAKHSVDV